jgi:hypothetical protein
VIHAVVPARDIVSPRDDAVAQHDAVPKATRATWYPEDIVDEWGAGSFPASDPPANW